MSGLAIWSGVDIDEASEMTESAIDEYTTNQTYYREKNKFSKYLTIGFYTHTSDNQYIRTAGEYAGYIDPAQGVLDTIDMMVDVANAAREAANNMRQVTTGAGADIGRGEMDSRLPDSQYQLRKQLIQNPNAPVQQQSAQGGFLSDMWNKFLGKK